MASSTKKSRSESPKPAVPKTTATKTLNATPASRVPLWVLFTGFTVMLYALFEVYGPALHGPFLFDDLFLPYAKSQAHPVPLREWLGIRPVLGLTFWADYQLWGRDSVPYHVGNLLIHFLAGVVLFFVFRKLLALGATAEPNRSILAGFGAALFLFHPIQTEVAAYVASRSEALCMLFFATAFCVFLYRRQLAISWQRTALVLFFFLLAIGSKEPAVTLPAILLLTDYFWNPGFSFTGIRANLRLYIPIAALGLAGALYVFRYIASDPMIGFHIDGLGPGTYFLTESRVIFRYLLLFFLPYGQNVDHDFPLSHSLTEHGAILALAGLALLLAAAILYRKDFPFAAYGFIAFLILLSPTSSIIPINDVIVERRLYLPFFALVMILFEPLRRLRLRPLPLSAALGLVCCLAAYATWERAGVWSSSLSLFQDAAQKSPNKARVRIGYANALYHQGRCREAIEEYGAATRLKTTDYILYYNLAAAYDCAKLPQDAISVLNRSVALHPRANAYALIGKILSDEGKLDESMVALQTALSLDASYTPALVLRAVVHAAKGERKLAVDDFTETLRRDPQNDLARRGLEQLQQRQTL